MGRTAFAASGLVRDAVERSIERVCVAAHLRPDLARLQAEQGNASDKPVA
jgi:hypothetical protein